MHHFIQRWSNEPAEPDYIDCLTPGRLQNLFRRDHHAKINDFEIITAEHYRNDIFSDVVHVTFYCSHQHFGLRPPVWPAGPFRLHKRSQVRHRFFHNARTLDDLGQKHLSGTKQIPDHTHSGHERTFDYRDWLTVFLPRFLSVFLDVFDDPLDKRMRQAFLDSSGSPGLGSD